MKRKLVVDFSKLLRVSFALLPVSFISLNFLICRGLAQTSIGSDLPEGRNLYDSFTEGNQKGNIFDATNPLELMNRLRRATAMDNATSPSDAIDNALKALEESEKRGIE